LHSLDTLNLSSPVLYGTGDFLREFKPGEEREVAFRVNAYGSASVYATIIARRDGDHFWWESGLTRVYVEDKAELERLLVLSHPYTTIGKTISAEATIKGLQKSTELKLEFWVEPPSGKSEKQAEINIKELSVGEEARYSAIVHTQGNGDLHHIRIFIPWLEKNRSQDKYHLCAKRLAIARSTWKFSTPFLSNRLSWPWPRLRQTVSSEAIKVKGEPAN
jgi:hypothetical protein